LACGAAAALIASRSRAATDPAQTPGDAGSARFIPQKASARVIIDNDFAGDPDGLVALAHQLLSPKTRTVLLTSTTLDPKLAIGERSDRAAAGRDLALELIRRLGVADPPPVIAGPEIDEPANTQPSDAARAIVAEALRDDPLPLYFTCGGPLTNLAAALRLEPTIARRMMVIWIGGGAYPDGGWEYNLATDPEAAREVIENSTVPFWQVPQNTYRQMQVSIAELAADMRPISPFARWLYERFTSPPAWANIGGAWPLGDSPLVLLTAISTESSRYSDVHARRIERMPALRYGAEIPTRTIRVYETIDVRLAWADFLAQLRLNAAGTGSPRA